MLLSLTFLVAAAGYYLKIKKVKRAIKKELASGKIQFNQVTIFSSKQIKEANWVEPKEFRLNGNMYDVFKTDTCDNEIIYHTFLDNEETTWATLLIEHYKNQTPINAGKDFNPLKYLMKDLVYENVKNTPLDWVISENTILYNDAIFYSDFIIGITTPPPEIVASLL